ncbi:MAG: energy transducer TonB family protein [Bacteroidales bacterium]
MILIDKDKRKSILVTVLFHALMLLCLTYLVLRGPSPVPAEQGVEVDLGYSADGMGLIQPENSGAGTPVRQSVAPVEKNEDEAIITQNTEEAPAVKEKQKEIVRKEVVKKKVESKPEPKPEPEVKAEPEKVVQQVDQRSLFKGNSKQGNPGGSEGITGKPGDQGNPDGLKDVKRYDGNGGSGGGPKVSLGGRGTKYLDKPQADVTERGEVVVDIWVDRNGRVTKAQIATKGTSIVSLSLRDIALKAAQKSTFAADPDAAELQKGTITYTFII